MSAKKHYALRAIEVSKRFDQYFTRYAQLGAKEQICRCGNVFTPGERGFKYCPTCNAVWKQRFERMAA